MKFEPDAVAINALAGKIVRIELETTIATPSETDKLAFIIVGEGIRYTLDSGSNIIKDTGPMGTTQPIDDIDGTVTTIKQSTDTFTIVVKETTDNAGAETTANEWASC